MRQLHIALKWLDFEYSGVIRGSVKSLDELGIVIGAINNNLRKVFGVAMQSAEYEVRTLDGKKVSETVHQLWRLISVASTIR